MKSKSVRLKSIEVKLKREREREREISKRKTNGLKLVKNINQIIKSKIN